MNQDELCQFMESQFQQLQENIYHKFANIEAKIETLEHSLSSNTKQPSFVGHVENKVEYLNETYGNPNQKNNHYDISEQIDICAFLSLRLEEYYQKDSNLELTYKDILRILSNTRSIYEVVAEQLSTLLGKSDYCVYPWIFSFASQKSVFYFWNHDSLSWNKIIPDLLKQLFEIVQTKLMEKYAWMIEKNHLNILNIDLIEGGVYLFADNFDKKCVEFKKMILQNLN